MVIKGKIKRGKYFDSVALMIVARELDKISGVEDAAVVMGTEENRSILESSGLLLPEFDTSKSSDLLIGIKAKNEEIAEAAIQQVDEIIKRLRNKQDKDDESRPKSLESALSLLPDANLELISIPGKYAAKEAFKALYKGLNVMIFSDNVTLKDEVKLKKYAHENDLFVMGPDCGTAIINGVPLAFANVVNRGKISIVAASGTGLQEISSIISNKGEGIWQAIGTGGRDVKKEVGGIMFMQALTALGNDNNTEVIVLVSKPPASEVLAKILDKVNEIQKPVVAIFLGNDMKKFKESHLHFAKNLEEAALLAVSLVQKEDKTAYEDILEERTSKLSKKAQMINREMQTGQKYLRGLFCGGSLCQEAEVILRDIIGDVYSNITPKKKYLLQDTKKSKKNTLIDMGADEFTVGRPHPMIDYSLRNERILQEADDEEVGVILFDVVLGYGSNLNPASELLPVIMQAEKKAESKGRKLAFLCSITGTEQDPQNMHEIKAKLTNAGVHVLDSNAAAAQFAGLIIKNL